MACVTPIAVSLFETKRAVGRRDASERSRESSRARGSCRKSAYMTGASPGRARTPPRRPGSHQDAPSYSKGREPSGDRGDVVMTERQDVTGHVKAA